MIITIDSFLDGNKSADHGELQLPARRQDSRQFSMLLHLNNLLGLSRKPSEMRSRFIPRGLCRPASQPIGLEGATPSLSANFRCKGPRSLRTAARHSGKEAPVGEGSFPKNRMMAGMQRALGPLRCLPIR